jgi:hypothetical protein
LFHGEYNAQSFARGTTSAPRYCVFLFNYGFLPTATFSRY